ncbi:MAG: hypothetical protein JST94_11425 [Bacteroidetes bacterium]|nr:hypothetical protein [Bacteroidota bacterium]MBS1641345.1 hypothetical protein [Bacteroidota bacterium]MBS1672036.1 hypothetical protein [Bacteroidota bacterium]
MTKVVLEIPTEKVQPFLHLVMKLGIDKHAIASKQNDEINLNSSRNFFTKLPPRFLKFDWEYFNNELEFE